MENLRSIVDVRHTTIAKEYGKFVSKSTFASQKIFSKKLILFAKLKKC